MKERYLSHVRATIDEIRAAGFYKSERVIASPQSSDIRLADGNEVLNFCANNYLGLADDRRLIDAAKAGLDEDGFGMASVRFICGTQSVHKTLEKSLADFLQTDDCHPLFELFRCEWRTVRNAAGRGRRNHQRRTEPREHHRRRAAVEGEALALQEQRSRRSRNETAGSRRGRRALQADRHRRRLFDGRHHRRPRWHLRSRRPLRRARHGRRLARSRVHRPERARHAGTLRCAAIASTSSPARSARRSAAHRAAMSPRTRRSSSCCGNAAGRTSFRIRLRRASRRRR